MESAYALEPGVATGGDGSGICGDKAAKQAAFVQYYRRVLNEGTQAEIEAWLLTFPLFTSFNTAGAPAASLFDLCAQRYNNRLSSFFCFSPQSKVAAQRSSILCAFQIYRTHRQER
jgi:hypothetical protein